MTQTTGTKPKPIVMTANLKPAVDAALMEKVRQVDLSQVRNYLIVKKGWTHTRATNAIEGYYRFLYLGGTFHKVRPPKDIDEVWHRHILHTEQYQSDCMNLFGRFIHHRPFPIELAVESDCETDCESKRADCETDCESKVADCETDCESRVEVKADCETDCESRTQADCETDCESRMKDCETDCESADDDSGGGDSGGDDSGDDDDGDDDKYTAARKSYSFTELSRMVFGNEWRAELN